MSNIIANDALHTILAVLRKDAGNVKSPYTLTPDQETRAKNILLEGEDATTRLAVDAAIALLEAYSEGALKRSSVKALKDALELNTTSTRTKRLVPIPIDLTPFIDVNELSNYDDAVKRFFKGETVADFVFDEKQVAAINQLLCRGGYPSIKHLIDYALLLLLDRG